MDAGTHALLHLRLVDLGVLAKVDAVRKLYCWCAG